MTTVSLPIKSTAVFRITLIEAVLNASIVDCLA